MAEKLRIGVIGCGQMGRRLAEAVAASGLGRIQAVFDIDAAAGLALARAQHAEIACSEEALVTRSDLHAVIIAVPPFLHQEIALQAARAGLHIFLEKPMALGAAACREINQAVERAGVTLMVGHILRYYEPFRTILAWARGGQLGAPRHGVVWRFDRDYMHQAAWKASRAQSGGYLYEIGAHELDWLRRLFGAPVAVSGLISKRLPSNHEIEDLVSVQLQFEGGAVATYTGGTGLPANEYGFRLRFEQAMLQSAAAFDPQTLKIDCTGDVRLESSFAQGDPFEAEMHDWLTSLIDGKTPPITGQDGGETVALIERVYESARLASVGNVNGSC